MRWFATPRPFAANPRRLLQTVVEQRARRLRFTVQLHFLDKCIYDMYRCLMRIVWDPEKAEQNYRKHKVRFSDAEPVLFDPMALSREDQSADDEQRFVAIGTDALGRVLVVVYTYRGRDIRLISARRATKNERKSYEEGI